MKYLLLFTVSLAFFQLDAQDLAYADDFDKGILSVGNNPTGYTMSLEDEHFQIKGNGNASAWTAMTYRMHDGAGSNLLVDASQVPKLYIRAKGTMRPKLRIDLQDRAGHFTNLNPWEVDLDEDYEVYELDFTGRLLDGAFGGPCTSSPCMVDASSLQALVLFVNAPDGGYSGTVDIDWVSIGAPLEPGSISSNLEIRYNQVAYLTGRPKVINVVSNASFSDVAYAVYEEGSSTALLEGVAGSSTVWAPSREFADAIDITAIDAPGNYVFETADKSITFRVSTDGYDLLSEASLKYYYFNRASQELTAEFAGPWARPLGHPDDRVLVHSSAASANRPTGTVISSPKGWYDAGDYNKYIVNSGISTYTLLAAYEHYPEYYEKLSIDIPEQGGDLPDILDEVIWNLDWMLTMQDPGDGGVYHKLTGLDFSGIIMPHRYNATRYVVQKSTAAALNFAAVLATASRIFEEFEDVRPGYSATLLEAARNAYTWAKANPTNFYNQPSDVRTGEYGDRNVRDEFDWAAVELFITTGEATFRSDFNEGSIGGGVPAWPYTAPLALISLSHHADEIGSDVNANAVKNLLIRSANPLRSAVQQSALQVAMSDNGDYVWGSNGVAGNQIMMLIRAYESTDDESYLDAAYTAMDYLLGRNGTGYSYVSGFGDQSPRRPHHRQSEADNVDDPVPGMLAGGPNPGQQDNCSGYPNNFPASSYVDSWCSFASNEVTINWNAPLAYGINALRFYQVGLTTSTEDLDVTGQNSLMIYPNPGVSTVYIPELENGVGQSRRLEVIDLSGKVVLQDYTLNAARIDVSALPVGIYVFKLFNGNTVSTAKWVKAN